MSNHLAKLCVATAILSIPSWALAQIKICVANVDGTELRTVADVPGSAWSGSPIWSHDGKRIAFDSTTDNFENDHVFVVDVDGNNLRDLGLGSEPHWNPDDKQLLFFTLPKNPADEKVGIWLMNSEGQARQFITPGTKGRWSCDGGKIAYLNKVKNANTIWIYNVVDAEAKPALQESYLKISPPVWSPDDKQICFVGTRPDTSATELCVIDAEGEHQVTTLLKEGVSPMTWPSWAPNKNILFGAPTNNNRPKLTIFDFESLSVQKSIDLNVSLFMEPSWSPDGKQIAFSLRE
jgi:Tol biopolymer transport system component